MAASPGMHERVELALADGRNRDGGGKASEDEGEGEGEAAAGKAAEGEQGCMRFFQVQNFFIVVIILSMSHPAAVGVDRVRGS